MTIGTIRGTALSRSSADSARPATAPPAPIALWPLDRRVPPRRAAWVGLLLVALGSILGVIVSRLTASGTGELALDVAISHHRSGALVAIAEVLSVAAGPIVGPLIIAVACGAIWLRDRVSAVVIGVLSAVGWLSVGVAKLVFQRQRPPGDLVHAVLVESGKDSFPSGHAALVAAAFAAGAVALSMSGRPITRLATIGAAAVLTMAATRLYLGVHYLGDVLAAPLFAVGAVLIASWLIPSLLIRTGRTGRGRTAP